MYICANWEQKFSLTAGWTQGKGPMAVSTPLGYCIHLLLTIFYQNFRSIIWLCKAGKIQFTQTSWTYSIFFLFFSFQLTLQKTSLQKPLPVIRTSLTSLHFLCSRKQLLWSSVIKKVFRKRLRLPPQKSFKSSKASIHSQILKGSFKLYFLSSFKTFLLLRDSKPYQAWTSPNSMSRKFHVIKTN